MKYIFIIVLSFFCINANAQIEDKSLNDIIVKVIKAYQNKDEVTLNNLISVDFFMENKWYLTIIDRFEACSA